MLVGHHGTAVECNADSGLLTAAEVHFVLSLPFQVLNPKSETASSPELKVPAKVFRDERAALLASKSASE